MKERRLLMKARANVGRLGRSPQLGDTSARWTRPKKIEIADSTVAKIDDFIDGCTKG